MRITKDQKKTAIRPFYGKLGIFSVDDIKSKHDGHWFSPNNMRFFRSRLLDEVFCGTENAYFVSSEQNGYNAPRLYTLRSFNPKTKDVSTVGEFQGYSTRTQALTAALYSAFDEAQEEVINSI